MTLVDWLTRHRDRNLRAKLADSAGTTVAYLLQLRHPTTTGKNVTPEMCEALFEATKALTPMAVIIPHEVRPDVARIMTLGTAAEQNTPERAA